MATTTNGKSVDAALKQIAELLVDSIRASLAAANLDKTKLQDSIEAIVSNGDTVTAYMIEYGQWVVSGRRKFARKVPIAALLGWIKTKGIVPRPINGRAMSVNSLAFAIQNAIYKNGIKGRDFVTPAVGDDFLALAEDLIIEALTEEFESALVTA